MRLLPLSGRLALAGLVLLALAGACAALRLWAATGALAGLGAALVGGYLVLSARALTRALTTASAAQARTARRAEASGRDQAHRMTSLGDDVAGLGTELSALDTALSALRAEVNDLRSGVRAVGTEVAAADARNAHEVDVLRADTARLLSEIGDLRTHSATSTAALGEAATDLADLRRRASAPAPARQGWDELARRRRPGACLVLLEGDELGAALEGTDETTPLVVGAAAEAALVHGTPHTVGGVLFSLDDAAGLSHERLTALTARMSWLRPDVPVLGVGRHAALLDSQAGALAERVGHAVAPQRLGPHVVRLVPVGPPTFPSAVSRGE